MSTIDSNIELFNQHVKVNLDGLTARGESIDDLTINLFKAYLCVTDRDFVRYMRNKKDAYDDGEYFTIEQLLTMSLIKFQILKVLIPHVRQAHIYPISPWEMIHPPGGDNAVCM
jgi:hypothetical protein